MRKAMRKANFKSVRGNFKFGTNHIPIQNFYLQDVVKDGDGYRAQDRRAPSSRTTRTSTSTSARSEVDRACALRLSAGRQKRALLPSCFLGAEVGPGIIRGPMSFCAGV